MVAEAAVTEEDSEAVEVTVVAEAQEVSKTSSLAEIPEMRISNRKSLSAGLQGHRRRH